MQDCFVCPIYLFKSEIAELLGKDAMEAQGINLEIQIPIHAAGGDVVRLSRILRSQPVGLEAEDQMGTSTCLGESAVHLRLVE